MVRTTPAIALPATPTLALIHALPAVATPVTATTDLAPTLVPTPKDLRRPPVTGAVDVEGPLPVDVSTLLALVVPLEVPVPATVRTLIRRTNVLLVPRRPTPLVPSARVTAAILGAPTKDVILAPAVPSQGHPLALEPTERVRLRLPPMIPFLPLRLPVHDARAVPLPPVATARLADAAPTPVTGTPLLTRRLPAGLGATTVVLVAMTIPSALTLPVLRTTLPRPTPATTFPATQVTAARIPALRLPPAVPVLVPIPAPVPNQTRPALLAAFPTVPVDERLHVPAPSIPAALLLTRRSRLTGA